MDGRGSGGGGGGGKGFGAKLEQFGGCRHCYWRRFGLRFKETLGHCSVTAFGFGVSFGFCFGIWVFDPELKVPVLSI